jgi:hypothetical protein
MSSNLEEIICMEMADNSLQRSLEIYPNTDDRTNVSDIRKENIATDTIYGPTQEEGHWHHRWNNELYRLYNDLNIVEDIRIRRLGWAGHIMRMEEGRIPKKVLNGKFHNTRPLGRPRIRWEDAVQKNALQILGTRGWRRRAENREEWRQLLREAKARKGL